VHTGERRAPQLRVCHLRSIGPGGMGRAECADAVMGKPRGGVGAFRLAPSLSIAPCSRPTPLPLTFFMIPD
jgi:hypothetical protein